MLKRTLSLLAASLLMASSVSASVIENGKIECFPLAHGVDGMGSKASVSVPPFFVQGSSRLETFITNIGSDGVNVNLKLFDEDGQPWFPATAPVYRGHFSTQNNPIRQPYGSEAALLKSFESGYFDIDDNSEPKIISGILTWQANKCLTKPTLSVSMSIYRYFPNDTSRDSSRTVTINGGNPF